MTLSAPPPPNVALVDKKLNVTLPWYDFFRRVWNTLNSIIITTPHAPITLYIRPGGNDNNDGSANDNAHAFATLQGAANYALHHIYPYGDGDSGQPNIVLKVADGTYHGSTYFQLGNPKFYFKIEGNLTNPENVVFTSDDYTLNLYFSQFYIDGFTISGPITAITAGSLARVRAGANLRFDGPSGLHWDIAQAAFVQSFDGGYKIVGDANVHLSVTETGTIRYDGHVFRFENAPNFTDAFMWIDTCGVAKFDNPAAFTGTCTGIKAIVQTNGALHSYFTLNESDLPGDQPMIIRSGGTFTTSSTQQFGPSSSGTYSPVITGSASNPTVTYFQNDGAWSRVGNHVKVRMDIVINAISTGSGDVQLSLPFQADSAGTISVGTIETDGITWPVGATYLTAYPQSATSVMKIGGIIPSNPSSLLQISALGNNDSIFVGLDYTCTQTSTGLLP